MWVDGVVNDSSVVGGGDEGCSMEEYGGWSMASRYDPVAMVISHHIGMGGW